MLVRQLIDLLSKFDDADQVDMETNDVRRVISISSVIPFESAARNKRRVLIISIDSKVT
jgi:hypothetical protein